MKPPVIMWFRQDLRLGHHPGLNAAATEGPVLPVYILDDETPGHWKIGGASRWWLHHSLASLNQRLPLVLRRGKADVELQRLLAETGASAVYFTRDYAPWSPALEGRVKAVCQAAGAACHRFGGYLLHEPETIHTGSGGVFQVYTPFSRACFARGEPRLPQASVPLTCWPGAVASDRLEDWQLLPKAPDWAAPFAPLWQPGEAGARQAIDHFIANGLPDYPEGRDFPSRAVTSRLSPHLHFGEISPAQCWQAVRTAAARAEGRLDAAAEKFLKELLWREFSYHILARAPDLPEKPFRENFVDFPWHDDPSALLKWQRGETGYPIVDAGMRELWHTGTMHNRVRMIVASFLTKHLLLPWQAGEAWFWDALLDADIASNAASWQWVAGSGADAAPYFRIFNPVLQGQKFDPHGTYVRKWLPQLQNLPDSVVHSPWLASPPPAAAVYPPPLVDHGQARQRALAAYHKLKTASV